MRDSVRLSPNELLGLLRYALRGVFGHDHDYNAVARAVLDLELDGHHGLTMLLEAESAEQLRLFSGHVSEAEDGTLVVDCAAISMLVVLPVLTDLIIAQARTEGAGRARVVKAGQVGAIRGAVYALNRAGVAAEIDADAGIIRFSAVAEGPLKTPPSAQRRAHLRDNIPVDAATLARLKTLSEAILVEASEASRRGAGE